MKYAVIVMIAIAAGQAVAADSDERKAQVDQILVRLDDDDMAVRQAAEKELVALGPEVIELLPPIRDRMPQELKLRLQRVRELLEKQSAEQATQPTSVTLQGKMSLSAALAEIQKQTGNRMLDMRAQQGQPANDPDLNLSLDEAPFWTAIDTVFADAKLQLYPYTGELNSMGFTAREENMVSDSEHVATAGLFRFEPTRVEAIRNLRSPNIQGMRMTVEISWEPRVAPIALTHSLESLRAVGDNDQPLAVTNSEGELEAAVQNTVGAVEIDIPFDLPPREVDQIKDFQGKIVALLPGRVVSFQFADLELAKNVPQRKGGVTVVLQGVRQNVDVQDVRILVQFDDASGALESHRGWVYNNEAYLLGPDNQRVDYSSFETTRQQENEVGLSYKFSGPVGLKGFQFIYKSPAAIVKLPVEYHLQNIPLP